MNENIKYFLYVRKSQESDERQVQSIDDQLKVMHEKAKSLWIEIVEVFTESMSAKAPGRYRFNEMIQRIKNKEASWIIAWKLDRLSRNPIDSWSIQYMLQMWELLKIVTNDKEYTIVDSWLLMSVENGMSNQFLLDLSKNVKRGLSSKLDKWWWPWPAPEWYKNDREYNTIVPWENFVLLRKIWDLMLSWKYTIVQILDIANNQLWFRTSKIKNKWGKKIWKSGIYFIFNNLFYTWNFERKWKIYKWSHPPMITIDEFQRVQSLFQEKRKPKLQKHHFSFTWVMVCWACWSMVTAWNKKKINKITNEEKIYNYYWCTRTKDSKCKQRVISSDELEKQYNEILWSIQISEEFKVWALDIIKNNLKNEMWNMDEIKRRLNTHEFQQKKKLDWLIDLLVDGTIDKPTYNLKKELFEKELLNIKQEIEWLENKSKLIIWNAEEILDFSLNAQNMFKIWDSSTKRVIAKNLGLHSVLYNKNLYVKLEKWFEVIKDNANWIWAKNAPIAPIVKGTSNGLLVPSDCIIPIWQGV